ncbi:capsule assembly Wzi family protein [Dyadobacter sp. CY343]|uniref:capsule assembly Wzi family protein n=1 Tax=Dyadobacter sp. CY343 TaxID=2907299 RepID=UPI001F2BE700|nr:capsule assembly Wzi family protein [Dyadobacter sp. CY343]MCE7058621.1 capsule assembly Wzi family protein [Dyadobacter sp. CY343]
MPFPVCQIRFCLILCISCFAFTAFSQDSTLYYKGSITAAGATGRTPFWQYANQHGSVPLDGNFGLADVGIYKIYNPNNPRTFQWSGGIQGIGSYGKSGNAFLSDAYLAAKINVFEILAGQKRMVSGLMDTTMTSGSLSMAGNSRPFPRVQIAIPKYFPLFFTNNFVAFKFSYSDGYLGSSRINYGSVNWIPNSYFHHKSLYFRIGGKQDRYKIYAGVNHQAVWGGEAETTPLRKLDPPTAYLYTIIGKTVDYRKIGNHFGTVDIGGEWKGKNWSYFIYRQNIYETGSLFKIINYTDGLNGVSVKRLKPLPKSKTYFAFQSFLLEVLGTQNQINKNPLSGLAIFESGNYYNSYLFNRGWSYYGSGIGTPLIPNAGNTREELPRSKSEFTNNNRLWAFHTGITATWMNLRLAFKGTYSRNSGTFISDYGSVKQQASVILNVEKNIKALKGSTVFTSISSDFGDLYENSTGIMIGFRKSGFID